MRKLVPLLALLAACGPHSLTLGLGFTADCPTSVPAGGSLLYEIAIDPIAGDPARVCSACLAVPSAVTDGEGVLALLRASAPPCPLPREASLQVRVTSFAGPDCAAANAGTAARLCSASDKLVAGTGRSDQTIDVSLSCQAGCNSTTCVPIPCSAQGKDCGTISNGCGETIDCGSCKPPEKCGGGGVDHVCGR